MNESKRICNNKASGRGEGGVGWVLTGAKVLLLTCQYTNEAALTSGRCRGCDCWSRPGHSCARSGSACSRRGGGQDGGSNQSVRSRLRRGHGSTRREWIETRQ